MSKQLKTLIEKAEMNKKAVINGRKVEYDFGQKYVGDLEEKWAVEKTAYGIFQLRHWGTVLIEACTVIKCADLQTLYAESKSDIDGINFFCEYFDIPIHAHYYPSRDEAEFHWNEDDTKITFC